MRRSTRVRLDMLQKVHEFSRQHMVPIAGYVDAVQLLGTKLDRAQVLAAQQESGDLEARGAKALKDTIRKAIEAEHVAHLVRIARATLPADPELRRRFRIPRDGLNRQEFVAAVRAMLGEAGSRRALFVSEGMPGTFVEDLEALLARYVGAITRKGLGESRRVSAVAELPAIAKEMMQVMRRLDAINRKRWQGNPELLAAWRSVKDVAWRHVKPEGTEPVGKGGKETAA